MEITFPNDSYPIDVPNFDWENFKAEKIFDECVFGWWGGVYIKITRAEYDNHTQKD